MDNWLTELLRKTNNPIFRTVILFLIALVTCLGIISILSDTGFSTEIQQQRTILWVISILIALIITSIAIIIELRRNKRKVFYKEPKSGKRYFIDTNRKAREIPDEDTYTYLAHILGVSSSESLQEIPTKKLVSIRGEDIISHDEWERPLNEEEKAQKAIKRKVSLALQKADVYFEEQTNPQMIKIQIANNSNIPLYIQRVNFQFYNLPQNALVGIYPIVSAGRINIPIKQDQVNLLPSATLQIELPLRQRWERAEIDRQRGHLGAFIIEAVREGVTASGVIIPI